MMNMVLEKQAVKCILNFSSFDILIFPPTYKRPSVRDEVSSYSHILQTVLFTLKETSGVFLKKGHFYSKSIYFISKECKSDKEMGYNLIFNIFF